jgi:hypothetical protein
LGDFEPYFFFERIYRGARVLSEAKKVGASKFVYKKIRVNPRKSVDKPPLKLNNMALDIINHFNAKDFFDSELLIFDYDKPTKQVRLKCHYVLDAITAVFKEVEADVFENIHVYIFHNVNGFRRRNVAKFKDKKNNLDAISAQISVNIDTISIKKHDEGFKLKIAFLDAFGEAYFQCDRIEFEQERGDKL